MLKDPAAKRMVARAEKLGIAGKYIAFTREIVKAAQRTLDQPVDLDMLGATGAAMMDLGFTPEATWAILAVTRSFAAGAHYIEEEQMLNYIMILTLEDGLSAPAAISRIVARSKTFLTQACGASIMAFGHAYGAFSAFGNRLEKYFHARRKADGRSYVGVNVVGSGNTALMEIGFSPNAGWCIGSVVRGFSCAAHALYNMKKGRAWGASRNEPMVQMIDLSMIKYVGPKDRIVPKQEERQEYARKQKEEGEYKKWVI
jgi:hypothetical protein